MRIGPRLLTNAVFIALFSICATVLLIGTMSYTYGKSTLEQQVEDRLILVRDLKANDLERYFTAMKKQATLFSNDEAGAWLTLAVSTPEEADLFIYDAKSCLNESKDLSKGQFEQMYAENAEKMLEQIESDYTQCFYSKLAAAVIKPAKCPSPMPSPSKM